MIISTLGMQVHGKYLIIQKNKYLQNYIMYALGTYNIIR